MKLFVMGILLKQAKREFLNQSKSKIKFRITHDAFSHSYRKVCELKVEFSNSCCHKEFDLRSTLMQTLDEEDTLGKPLQLNQERFYMVDFRKRKKNMRSILRLQ